MTSPARAVTSQGSVRSSSSPSPRRPYSPPPQEKTLPPAVRAREWSRPHATWRTNISSSPAMRWGSLRLSVPPPCPSTSGPASPCMSYIQLHTPPSSTTASMCEPPSANSLTLFGATAGESFSMTAWNSRGTGLPRPHSNPPVPCAPQAGPTDIAIMDPESCAVWEPRRPCELALLGRAERPPEEFWVDALHGLGRLLVDTWGLSSSTPPRSWHAPLNVLSAAARMGSCSTSATDGRSAGDLLMHRSTSATNAGS
mmetsp:Transcript_54536/g.173294  ORF Transcript_54536/g.173294 Transcript_54536/m.173294 type:complete len:255 (+) Transcript_54536:915-1679(+)